MTRMVVQAGPRTWRPFGCNLLMIRGSYALALPNRSLHDLLFQRPTGDTGPAPPAVGIGIADRYISMGYDKLSKVSTISATGWTIAIQTKKLRIHFLHNRKDTRMSDNVARQWRNTDKWRNMALWTITDLLHEARKVSPK